MIFKRGGLAAWLIDDHLLVAELPQRYLRLYNPAAAALWLLLAEGTRDRANLVSAYAELFGQAEDQVRADVAQLLAQWHNLGWLIGCEAGRLSFAHQCAADAPGDVAAGPQALPAHEVIFDEVFSLGAAEFGVRIGETKAMGPSGLAARVAAMLRGFPIATAARAPVTLVMVAAENATYLYDGTASISVWHDPAEALSLVILAIFRLAYPQDVILATLHAAAAGLSGTVLLPGVSGAGKSTLTAHLSSAGWRYYGDDIVALSDAGAVLPMPTAISLKEGSWTVVQDRYPELASLGNIHYGSKTARYLPVFAGPGHDAETRQIVAWVFPSYQAGAATRFDALTAVEALQALITSGMALEARISHQGIAAFLDCLTRLPKYRLVYSNLNEAEQCLRSLVPA